MIHGVRTVGVDVSDQDRAVEFYTTNLRSDEPMDPPARHDGSRSRRCGQRPRRCSSPHPPAKRRSGRSPVASSPARTSPPPHREVTESGVVFTEAPTEQPWGWWTQFQDPDANTFGLVQRAD